MNYKKLFIIALLFISSLVVTSKVHAATTSLSGYAWSSNIGWISFNCSNTSTCGTANYKVSVTTSGTVGTLSGYAWSSNIGWVSFNAADVSGCPSAPCTATVDISTGSVTGWGRAIAGVGRTDGWDGWIHLSGTNHLTIGGLTGSNVSTQGVSYNISSRAFSGYAWGSDVVGWVSFNPTAGLGVNWPNTTPASCTIGPVTFSGLDPYDTSIPITVTNGTPLSSYDMRINASAQLNSVTTDSSGNYSGTVNMTGTAQGTYTYTLEPSGGSVLCTSGPTVIGTPVTKYENLSIAKSSTALPADLLNAADSYDSIKVKKGSSFVLGWGIHDTAGLTKSYRINPRTSNVNWDTKLSAAAITLAGTSEASDIILNIDTTGVPNGKYDFDLETALDLGAPGVPGGPGGPGGPGTGTGSASGSGTGSGSGSGPGPSWVVADTVHLNVVTSTIEEH